MKRAATADANSIFSGGLIWIESFLLSCTFVQSAVQKIERLFEFKGGTRELRLQTRTNCAHFDDS